MKHIITIALFSVLLLVGCSENSSIIAPDDSSTGSGLSWVTLESGSELKLNRVTVTGAQINGADGGSLSINESYGNVSINGNLVFPAGSFSGTKHFIYRVDDNKALVDFLPGATFDKDLTFDITISGIIVEGLNSAITFAYLDNSGAIQPAEYTSVLYDDVNKVLEVKGAKINHFSRYGWAKSDGTD